jgi:hypothetical protein
MGVNGLAITDYWLPITVIGYLVISFEDDSTEDDQTNDR